ncbi:MAG TPA: carboxypeptidase M32 [Planctomycetaceae bacterium]|nr:carboxypeptidase M32 [Planctomycetaceae bacterium]HRF01086.1 carboxypeptidase M32 [Pirellulaceae bacterium]
MEDLESLWNRLVAHERQTSLLTSIVSILSWDERTGLPPRGAEWRAEQLAYLAGQVHQRRTSTELGDLLERLRESELAADPHSDRGATIARLKHDYDKERKLPQRLVEELSRAEVLGQQAWVEARAARDFARFRPSLETNLRLRREQADATGYESNRYDALLDSYEPGETTENVRRALSDLRAALLPLLARVRDSGVPQDDSILHGDFPVDAQRRIGRRAAEAIGFDFERGRLDETDHPFCTEAGPHDHRILTRYDAGGFAQAFYGTLHEAGHGIYEQGLRSAFYGLPPGAFVSLGLHESQSRLWENLVGRSRSFWEFLYGEVRQAFPAALGAIGLDSFWRAVNVVRPSLIRVEADELTYNLHIIARFELEEALVRGDLPVDELPAAWNAKYAEYLGIVPPHDGVGVLQDVHWSAALFGYFPTYALGNLYAGHWFEAAQRDLGDLDAMFRVGDFVPLRRWLNEHLHRHGRCYLPPELLQRVCGQSLSSRPLIAYLNAKLDRLLDRS